MMSASDEILNRLIAVTRASGPSFWAAWERVGLDYRLKATGEIFPPVWANMVLQQMHPGADLAVWS